MKTVWIVPIEPIDQRYTKQWYDNIPEDLRNMPYKSNDKIKQEMVNICREAQETKKENFKKLLTN